MWMCSKSQHFLKKEYFNTLLFWTIFSIFVRVLVEGNRRGNFCRFIYFKINESWEKNALHSFCIWKRQCPHFTLYCGRVLYLTAISIYKKEFPLFLPNLIFTTRNALTTDVNNTDGRTRKATRLNRFRIWY